MSLLLVFFGITLFLLMKRYLCEVYFCGVLDTRWWMAFQTTSISTMNGDGIIDTT